MHVLQTHMVTMSGRWLTNLQPLSMFSAAPGVADNVRLIVQTTMHCMASNREP